MRNNDYEQDKPNFEKYKKVESVLKYGIPWKEKPEISFVIPTFRRTALLKEAVKSIMNQRDTGILYEVIIIDNDWFELENTETGKLLMEYPPDRICYYQNRENIGMYGNWNRCLEMAGGGWIAMLHDDDLLSPDYMNIIGKIFPKLRNKDNIALVKAKSLPIHEGKVINLSFMKRKLNKWGAAKLLPYGKMDLAVIGPERVGVLGACSCGSLMNKKIYCKYGGFDEAHFPCADAYYPERLVMKHNFLAYHTMEVLGYYRYEENAQWKEETLLGDAEEYMIYRQYYENRDWLSRLMYRLFQNEMLYETKQSILRLGWESKLINTSEFRDFKKKVSKIMGSSIPQSSIKRFVYNGIYYFFCRMKIIVTLLFRR